MAHAGENRCRLIVQAVRETLKERRRHVLKGLVESTEPWRLEDGLVQVVLTGPEQGWLSVVPAPGPFHWRQSLWPWRAGEISGAVDKTAPSRAFAKLVEAEARLGRQIAAGETCVDLGAAPGGWTYVAAQRGARVVAVDRSPLRGDLLDHPRVTFQPGDAFTYRPERPVDWLICDVIAAPERTAELLLDWLRRSDLHWFVVTLKLKGPTDHAKVERLKQELPKWADPWFLTHLCANKGEVCAFGRRREESVPSR
jgi:23S rRNA (cytidine2498-2'-O)-methyltransferase